MATMNDPPEESISTFCDIAGVLRSEAITRLRVRNNDFTCTSVDASVAFVTTDANDLLFYSSRRTTITFSKQWKSTLKILLAER